MGDMRGGSWPLVSVMEMWPLAVEVPGSICRGDFGNREGKSRVLAFEQSCGMRLADRVWKEGPKAPSTQAESRRAGRFTGEMRGSLPLGSQQPG